MLNNELYREIHRIIQEETTKFADAVTSRCIELIEEYTNPCTPDFVMEEYEPPCTMPVLNSVDDIISAMPENFQKARRKQELSADNPVSEYESERKYKNNNS